MNKITLKPNSKALNLYKENLKPLSQEQKEAIIGMILGDASLQKQSKAGDYRLKYDLTAKNRLYAEHIIELLNGYVITELKHRFRLNKNNNIIEGVWFQTISHKEFNFFSELFINKLGKKSISKNLIKNYLTPRGLAYWFMDDGGKLDYSSKSKGIVFNTQGFTFEEVENMSKELN